MSQERGMVCRWTRMYLLAMTIIDFRHQKRLTTVNSLSSAYAVIAFRYIHRILFKSDLYPIHLGTSLRSDILST